MLNRLLLGSPDHRLPTPVPDLVSGLLVSLPLGPAVVGAMAVLWIPGRSFSARVTLGSCVTAHIYTWYLQASRHPVAQRRLHCEVDFKVIDIKALQGGGGGVTSHHGKADNQVFTREAKCTIQGSGGSWCLTRLCSERS